jgi:hypothetical protein
LYRCADVIAPVDADAFSRRASELIKRELPLKNIRVNKTRLLFLDSPLAVPFINRQPSLATTSPYPRAT